MVVGIDAVPDVFEQLWVHLRPAEIRRARELRTAGGLPEFSSGERSGGEEKDGIQIHSGTGHTFNELRKFEGEIVSDLNDGVWRRRVPGARIKHCVNEDWLKMYDKCGSVPRVVRSAAEPYPVN